MQSRIHDYMRAADIATIHDLVLAALNPIQGRGATHTE